MVEAARRPRRRPGENRERLLQAGIVEFGTRGYRGASTVAIAASAGVPQPHVYASFRTKRELFLACVERALTPLIRANSGDPDQAAGAHAAFDLAAVDTAAVASVAVDAAADAAVDAAASIDDETAALLFQAIAAVRDDEVGRDLAPQLDALRAGLGGVVFASTVARAAESAVARAARVSAR
ncbi:TetR/AcrR family transcriptional regulator [Leucobacter soli]|uniref:TetR/AcrR family transcriptional regulator n=1 Tax=Leucobacter soli TaxID=2812850 RepID=UPI001C406A2C|nr:TetR/AcrR family transcriptional regulator [Leucobacter soli]